MFLIQYYILQGRYRGRFHLAPEQYKPYERRLLWILFSYHLMCTVCHH